MLYTIILEYLQNSEYYKQGRIQEQTGRRTQKEKQGKWLGKMSGKLAKI